MYSSICRPPVRAPLQPLDPFALRRRRAVAPTDLEFVLAHPVSQRLGITPQLRCNRANRCPLNGSGVVESACEWLIQQRLNGVEMRSSGSLALLVAIITPHFVR